MSDAAGRSKPFIRDCTTHDVNELADTMRQEDVEEIFHASGRTPLEVLRAGFQNSEVIHAIQWGDRVVAIFGVVGITGQVGAPWMLGTDDLRRCWSLLRECREILDGLTSRYHYLTNAVWARNDVHVRWIRWLGFTFDGSDVRNGETFLHFHRIKQHV